LFYGHNSRTVALRQTTFGAMKDHKHTIFIWISTFFDQAFGYGVGGIFKLLRWM
jgi:hypothetical protein